MAHSVFVSYSSKDADVANQLVAAIEKRGIKCWIAPRDVQPGASYPAEIFRGISECRLVVLVFSCNSNSSQYVVREVERAVSMNKPVMPFRIHDIHPQPDLDLLLATRQWFDASRGSMREMTERLADAVARTLDVPVANGQTMNREHRGRSRRTWLAIGVLAVLALAVAVLVLNSRRGGAAVDSPPASRPATMPADWARQNLQTLGRFHREGWMTWDSGNAVVARHAYSTWLDRFVVVPEIEAELGALRRSLIAAPPAVNPKNPSETWKDFVTLSQVDFEHLSHLQLKVHKAAASSGVSSDEVARHFALEKLDVPPQ